MKIVRGALISFFFIVSIGLSRAADCPKHYIESGEFSKSCRGVVHQKHNTGGFAFTTSSIRRYESNAFVDVYESCIKNNSGRALPADWQAAEMPDIMVPNGCAFIKALPANRITKADQQSDFLNTCIKFGNTWEYSDSASYLPTPYERKNGTNDVVCAGVAGSGGTNGAPENASTLSKFLRATKEFFWESSTTFDVDKRAETEKLVAFVVDTHFQLLSDSEYQYRIEYFFKELDEGAFALFPGFDVSPPEPFSEQFAKSGWTEKSSNVGPKDRNTFEISLPYSDDMELADAAVYLTAHEDKAERHAVYIPILQAQ
ncbi:hypothetical protein [Rhizobium favelukesii]|uniref:hypothetical protein n=1 Tax=Rhizobium favelukesii TaxID=348824 RepID=UPI00215FB20B|nr:hypothetical protein [Rhizobium favelukesii]MCS0459556.1 hypothetical protein [Rhizobium favelukesii]